MVLSVNAVWLCPCFKSPDDNKGPEISDFLDIMDELGTQVDMRAHHRITELDITGAVL